MNPPKPPSRRLELLLWTGLILVVATIFLGLLLAQLKLRVVLGKPLPVYGHIGEFTLTNQLAQTVTAASLRGNIWVADIIFTRCPGPCLKMSRLMKDLQQNLPSSSKTRFVSLTTDPDYDTPPVLKKYADQFRADPRRWIFLTGSKSDIANLAVRSLKLTAIEKKPEERTSDMDLFIHSTIFVIVDKAGQLRGIFESTGEGVDPQNIKPEIQAAIRRLERER